MPEKKIRIVLGDRYALNLEGVSAVLKGQRGVSIVATAVDPKKLAEAVKAKEPDVVVVDSQMLRKVSARSINGSSRVIQLADAGEIISPTPATKGVVRRSEGGKSLFTAIRKVAKGETYEMPQPSKKRAGLSRRETDVVHLVSKGLSNRAIADDLGLSEQSVKNLVSRVLRKLSLDNRVQLALLRRG